MDITTAQGELAGTIATKQKEIDALALAMTILSDSFRAEFTARDQAISEMGQSYRKLEDEQSAHRTTKAQLDEKISEVQALSAEIDSKTAMLQERDAAIVDMQTELDAVKSASVTLQENPSSLPAPDNQIPNNL